MKNRTRSAALAATLILVVFGMIPSQTQGGRWQLQGTVTAINCLDSHVSVRSAGNIVWTVIFADPADCQKMKLNAIVKVTGVPAAGGQKTLAEAAFKGFVASDQAVGAGTMTVTGTCVRQDCIHLYLEMKDDSGKLWRVEFAKTSDCLPVNAGTRVSVTGEYSTLLPNKLVNAKGGVMSEDHADVLRPGEKPKGLARHRLDFNGDGKDDIISFYRPRGGEDQFGPSEVCVALSDGASFKLEDHVWAEKFINGCEIPAVGRLTQDSRADILGFLRGDKKEDSVIKLRLNTATAGEFMKFQGPAGIWDESDFAWMGGCSGTKVPILLDITGDKIDEIAVLTLSNEGGCKAGDVNVFKFSPDRKMTDSGRWLQDFCHQDRWPAAGDFNGDGKDDLIYFVRSSASGEREGDVFVALSTGTGLSPQTRWHDWFCVRNEIPLVGDFNGDGKDDIASFTRNEYPGVVSKVWVALSNGSSFGTPTVWTQGFCLGNEVPLAGDFDGDGYCDVAAFTHDTGAANEPKGRVMVALSNGQNAFNQSRRWISRFCLGEEIPSTYSALFPYWMYPYSAEGTDTDIGIYRSDEDTWFSWWSHAFSERMTGYWPIKDYYPGEAKQLLAESLRYADSVDLAYAGGHGAPAFININVNEPVDLKTALFGSWSSPSRTGDLEWIAFQSCSVTSLEGTEEEPWCTRWLCTASRLRPFAGLHGALGFAEVYWSCAWTGSTLATWFASYLKTGYSVPMSWMEAYQEEAEDNPSHNVPCAIYLEPYFNENLSAIQSEDYWYHQSEYRIAAYVME